MGTMNIDEIMKVLPHRYPFLLVDKIVECDDVKRIVGIKNVSVNEPFFQGHFPGRPIMPGVLQIEAMAQTAGVLVSRIAGKVGAIPLFMTIDRAKFRRPVRPGDQMRIEVDLLSSRPRAGKLKGKIFVDSELASEAELMCMLTDEKAST